MLQIDVISIPSGHLVMAYNDDGESSRNTLALAVSSDGGQEWRRACVLESDSRGSFHYPTLLHLPEQVGLAIPHLQVSLCLLKLGFSIAQDGSAIGDLWGLCRGACLSSILWTFCQRANRLLEWRQRSQRVCIVETSLHKVRDPVLEFSRTRKLACLLLRVLPAQLQPAAMPSSVVACAIHRRETRSDVHTMHGAGIPGACVLLC